MYYKIEINDFRLLKNKTIFFGKYLTILSGKNSTGKSTILGMIANSGELKKKDGLTYFSKPFRAEFGELFKASEKYDKAGSKRFKIILSDAEGNEIDYRLFRTSWQKASLRKPKKEKSELIETSRQCCKRFRVIPYKKDEMGKCSEAKFIYPVIYLGLSRLFPIGESKGDSITNKNVSFKSKEHRDWFIKNYKEILSIHDDIDDISNLFISETDKKIGIGISTEHYDYLTNSAGQDNLGQILLALLSLKKLKEESENWQGGILLIDEVDATLHPAAQIKLIKLLVHEAKKNEIQVVFTTHSLTVLKELAPKENHNNEGINNIELYYLTNANRSLEIKRNPTISMIEHDLLIISDVQSFDRIKVFTEDEEARWFMKKILPEHYANCVQFLDTKIGYNQLISIYNADLYYFSETLLVLDGDVPESQISCIKTFDNQSPKNVLKLPGESSPEKEIYDYIISLGSNHDFWKVGERVGFTWEYFNENGPYSDDYANEPVREKYKKWFLKHQVFFDSLNLMYYWKKDNDYKTKEFIKKFRMAYNSIALRTSRQLIKDFNSDEPEKVYS